MKPTRNLNNRVAERRTARKWSQQELADRSRLSRTEISAIETGRVVPSAAAAIELARIFGCPVEDLFFFAAAAQTDVNDWFAEPPSLPCRFWTAELLGRTLRIPVEPTHAGVALHHGTWTGTESSPASDSFADKTLVMAGCDPASALLAAELNQRFGITLLTLIRSTGEALTLLKNNKVHVGGLHGGTRADANRRLVRERLGKDFVLLRIAQWEEGVVLAPSISVRGLNDAALHRLAWVGREEGSGARRCMDQLLRDAPRRRKTSEHIVRDHRSVAAAVKGGWAEAGICIRLSAEEVGLGFLPIQQEPYDLCFHKSLQDDPRIKALIECVRSTRIRRAIADLPGYFASQTGELDRVTV